MGDLNTMGMAFPRQRKKDRRVSEEEEIEALKEFAEEAGMKLLDKQFDQTFDNGKLRSNLDHALVSEHLPVKEAGKRADGTPYFVRVDGWQQLEGGERKRFIEEISDHCSVGVEVGL